MIASRQSSQHVCSAAVVPSPGRRGLGIDRRLVVAREVDRSRWPSFPHRNSSRVLRQPHGRSAPPGRPPRGCLCRKPAHLSSQPPRACSRPWESTRKRNRGADEQSDARSAPEVQAGGSRRYAGSVGNYTNRYLVYPLMSVVSWTVRSLGRSHRGTLAELRCARTCGGGVVTDARKGAHFTVPSDCRSTRLQQSPLARLNGSREVASLLAQEGRRPRHARRRPRGATVVLGAGAAGEGLEDLDHNDDAVSKVVAPARTPIIRSTQWNTTR
jgi:hypothetical protein